MLRCLLDASATVLWERYQETPPTCKLYLKLDSDLQVQAVRKPDGCVFIDIYRCCCSEISYEKDYETNSEPARSSPDRMHLTPKFNMWIIR